jgi:hypothetical protein
MATTPASNTGAVVNDANVVIAVCAGEQNKLDSAKTATEQTM